MLNRKFQYSFQSPFTEKKRIGQSYINTLMLCGTILIWISYAVHQLLLASFLILIALILAFPKTSHQILTRFEAFQRRTHLNLYSLAFGISLIILFLDLAAFPSQAQFFFTAEEWMIDAFATGGGNVETTINLIFNSLRAIFIIYIAVALVRVIQAARDDQDWQGLARAPLIITVAMVMGDVITSFITG